MASQELRTQLVFEAANAIKSCEILQSTLDKISKIDFSNVANGFKEMGKIINKEMGDAVKAAEKIKKVNAEVVESEKQKKEAVEQTQKAVDKAADRAQKAAEKQAKAEADAAAKAAKAAAQEAKDIRDLEQKTLTMVARVNKALEVLQRRILKASDFNVLERDLKKIVNEVDDLNKKLGRNVNFKGAVERFMQNVDEINKKHLEQAQKRAAEDIQNLFQRHRALMTRIADEYTKNPKANFKREQEELIGLTREVARLSDVLGKAGQAAGYFKQAFNLAHGKKVFAELNDEIRVFMQDRNVKDRAWRRLNENSYLETYRGLHKELEAGGLSKTKTEQLKRDLAQVNAELAKMYREAGNAEKGLRHLKEAMQLTEGKPNVQKPYRQQS